MQWQSPPDERRNTPFFLLHRNQLNLVYAAAHRFIDRGEWALLTANPVLPEPNWKLRDEVFLVASSSVACGEPYSRLVVVAPASD
jgi:hypothetical protein